MIRILLVKRKEIHRDFCNEFSIYHIEKRLNPWKRKKLTVHFAGVFHFSRWKKTLIRILPEKKKEIYRDFYKEF